MNIECEFCQHRDAVYLADIRHGGASTYLCATCIRVFPNAIIEAEADTRNM